MISPFRFSLLPMIAALSIAQPGFAQTPSDTGGAATTGLTTCASDVAVAATRSRISLESGGKAVPALLYEPQGVPVAGSALVIMLGRSIEDDLIALDNHAIQLASRGFAVIVPFYLEAERAQDEPARARAAHRIWREVAVDAADAIASEMGLDTNRVVLWGHTRGGGVALAAALEPGSRVGGAVGVNIGGVPQDDAQGAGRPFLLIHSAHSSLLPARQVRSMGDRIRERGGQVDLLEIAADDGQFGPADWCRVMDGTRGLLERVAGSAAVVPTGG